ncbi:MAG: hypothetical protein AAFN41_11915, partial [Planctomycetota bacterium]
MSDTQPTGAGPTDNPNPEANAPEAHTPEKAPPSEAPAAPATAADAEAEIQQELDQAMAELDAMKSGDSATPHPHDAAEVEAAKKAAETAPKKGLRGPRVV